MNTLYIKDVLGIDQNRTELFVCVQVDLEYDLRNGFSVLSVEAGSYEIVKKPIVDLISNINFEKMPKIDKRNYTQMLRGEY